MIRIDGRATLKDIVAIADRTSPVELATHTRAAVTKAHDRASELATLFPTYGRTTGVGANRLVAISEAGDSAGVRLLRSHAADTGKPLSPRSVRAMLAVRLNQLCIPGSGLDPKVLDGLLTMLNTNALPTIMEFGSIGTGDLTALAGTALTLMGERPASQPLDPMPAWEADSALAFISSSALTFGRACLCAVQLAELQRAATVIFGLSFVGLNGNRATFSPAAAAASASPTVSDMAAHIRSMLAPLDDEIFAAARIQDPFGLRVFGIVEGGLVAAIERLLDCLERLIRSGQENPLFDFSTSAVIHHGAFYQTELALDLDAVTLAIAHSATITHARLRLFNEPEYSGQRAFLAEGPAASSGVMILEYVAASAIAEMRNAAQPASIGTISLSRGTEEDASFATQGVVQLERAVSAYGELLACELVAAIRLLRQQDRIHHLDGTLALATEISSVLPRDGVDRDLRDDLGIAKGILSPLAHLTSR